MGIDRNIRISFSQLEGYDHLEIRRLKPVELAKYNQFSSTNLVGIFGSRNDELIAVVEFDDLFDLNGNRFHND
jgi:hypothetical protein